MTGIELIAKERQEQIEKHGRTIAKDVIENSGNYKIGGEQLHNPQLTDAARQLIYTDEDVFRMSYEHDIFHPYNWNKVLWLKMMNKNYKERLVIAGALIAAEIDRLQAQEATE